MGCVEYVQQVKSNGLRNGPGCQHGSNAFGADRRCSPVQSAAADVYLPTPVVVQPKGHAVQSMLASLTLKVPLAHATALPRR